MASTRDIEHDSEFSETTAIKNSKSCDQRNIKMRWGDDSFVLNAQDTQPNGVQRERNKIQRDLDVNERVNEHIQIDPAGLQKVQNDSLSDSKANNTGSNVLGNSDINSTTHSQKWVIDSCDVPEECLVPHGTENSSKESHSNVLETHISAKIPRRDSTLADHNDFEVEQILEKCSSSNSFHCDFCGRTFQRKTQMLLHQKKHEILGHSKLCRNNTQNEKDERNHEVIQNKIHEHKKRKYHKYNASIRKIYSKNIFKKAKPLSKLLRKSHREMLGVSKKKNVTDSQMCKYQYSKEKDGLLQRQDAHYFRHISSPNADDLISAKLYSCSLCPMAFKSDAILKEHMCFHTRSMPFYCKQCNKSFGARFSYDNHMWSHKRKPSSVLNENCKRNTLVSSDSDDKTFDVKKEDIDLINQKENKGHNVCDFSFDESTDDNEEIRSSSSENVTSTHSSEAQLGGQINNKGSSHLDNPGFLPVPRKADNSTMEIKEELDDGSYELCNSDTYQTQFIENTDIGLHSAQDIGNVSNIPRHVSKDSNESNGQKIFHCKKCDQSFTRRFEYLVHKKEHTESGTLSCDICKKQFSCLSDLRRHAVIHDDKRPHICNYCGKSFRRPSNLKEHYRIHTGLYPFKCNICHKGFNSRSRLECHNLKNECGAGQSANDGPTVEGSDPGSYNSEMVEKDNENSGHFDGDDSLPDMSTSDNSIVTIKEEKDEGSYELSVSDTYETIYREEPDDENAVSADGITDNEVRMEESENIEDDIGDLSGKHEDLLYDLDRNKKKCDKSFVRRFRYPMYKKEHTKSGTLSCDICKRHFSCPRDLRRHAVVHDDIRPHFCNYCGKSFRRLSNLKEHCRLHTGIYPFKCNVCHKGFNSRPRLECHMQKSDCGAGQLENYGQIPNDESPVEGNDRGSYSSEMIEKDNDNSGHFVVNDPLPDMSTSEVKIKEEKDDGSYELSVSDTYEASYGENIEKNLPSTDGTIDSEVRLEESENIEDDVDDQSGKPEDLLYDLDSSKDPKIFHCKTCDKSFVRRFHYLMHRKEHAESGSLSCDICKKQFSCPRDVRRHAVVHFDIRPHVCSYCGKSFRRLSNLREHYRLHTGIYPYKCNICHKGFNSRTKVECHMKRNKCGAGQSANYGQIPNDEPTVEGNDPGSYSSEMIEKDNDNSGPFDGDDPLPDMSTSEVKIKEEKDDGSYEVSVSDTNEANYGEDINTKQIPPFYCNLCHHSYASKNLLKVHMLSHRKLETIPDLRHPFVENQTTAPTSTTCDMPFENVESSKLHYIKAHSMSSGEHEGQTDYQDARQDHGDYDVPSDSHLVASDSRSNVASRKGNVNNDIPKYKCSVCNLCFLRSSDLKVHKMEHRGELPFNCEVCSKIFHCRSDYQRHVVTHFNLKPYKCNICYKEFSRKSSLTKHKKLHPQDVLECKFCLQVFRSPTLLNNHVQNTHQADELIQEKSDLHSDKYCMSDDIYTHRADESIREKPDLYSEKNCMSNDINTHQADESIGEEPDQHSEKYCMSNDINTHQADDSIREKPDQHFDKYCMSDDINTDQGEELKEKPDQLSDKYCMSDDINTDQGEELIKEKPDQLSDNYCMSDDMKYRCKTCNQCFVKKADLALHKLEHSGKVPWTCQYCGKEFVFSSDFARHLLTHTGLRPFNCSICNKSFRRKSSMTRHKKHHAREDTTISETSKPISSGNTELKNIDDTIENIETEMDEDGSMYLFVSKK